MHRHTSIPVSVSPCTPGVELAVAVLVAREIQVNMYKYCNIFQNTRTNNILEVGIATAGACTVGGQDKSVLRCCGNL